MSVPTSILLVAAVVAVSPEGPDLDNLRDLQSKAVASKFERVARPYHFGSQGAGSTFSNHGSHTNRMVPVYTFGRKVDLGSVTGANSRYRTEAGVRPLYGAVPVNTVNPEADYADQSDLYKVQKDAVGRGVKYLFTVWFDGLDWETTRAAAIVKTGRVAYDSGKGTGLAFQDYDAGGSARFGYVVTSPTHDKNTPDVDAQTVSIPAASLLGGYDALVAGPNPWTPGPLAAKAPGYLKGQSADAKDQAGIKAAGRVAHAYTDSSQSAGEYATGVKAYNNGVNVTDDNRFVPTLFESLQASGWKVGTVTSVPFDHVSPAAMYTHNVHRDDYQDLGREMLGIPSIVQQTGKYPARPGLDVVIGTGNAQESRPSDRDKGGKNMVPGNLYLTADDLARVDVRNGGKYVVVGAEPGSGTAAALADAAGRAAGSDRRLFGFFGTKLASHLPYATANGDYRPVGGVNSKAEAYGPDELALPTLGALTDAALTTLSAGGRPFALFVEAGDVDWALHDNNLDNAVGAVFSGEDAVRRIIAWVEKNSNWDESALIVTSDHGHYLVIDDPAALAARK